MFKFFLMLIVSLSLSASAIPETTKRDTLQHLYHVIAATQTLREDTFSQQADDTLSFALLTQVRTEQLQSFQQLQKDFRSIDPDIAKEFSTLEHYMQVLYEEAPFLDSRTVFNAYSTLINRMITNYQTIKYSFYAKGSDPVDKVSNSSAKDLILLEEKFSLLKALCSGLIQQSYSEPESDELLLETAEMAEDLVRQLQQNVQYMSQDSSLRSQELIKELESCTTAYLTQLQTVVGNENMYDLNAVDFNEKGEQVMLCIHNIIKKISIKPA